MKSKERTRQMLPKLGHSETWITWSDQENIFYLEGFHSNSIAAVTLHVDRPFKTLEIQTNVVSNSLKLLPAFGRASLGWSGGGEEWGSLFDRDECGDLIVRAERGLGSGLLVHAKGARWQDALVSVRINPGLLHLARFYFDDVSFVRDCDECLFDVENYLYVLDIKAKRVGTLVAGNRFSILAPRYQKRPYSILVGEFEAGFGR